MAKRTARSRPYSAWPEQWPDRTTTDHRELGHGVPEDRSLAWWLLGALILIILVII